MSHNESAIKVDSPSPGIARITLARPEVRNAQNSDMLYQLNAALDDAAHDSNVKVIIIAAQGKDFSAGHDLKWEWDLDRFKPVSVWGGGHDKPGAEGQYAREEELFLGLCKRWRNIPKPTVVQVQGRVIGAGLMLIWPFDIIVCSEEATFSDPTVALAINGVEFFAHPWEFGQRRAKEMLFRGRGVSAADALRAGMVNHVVPADKLEATVLEISAEISQQPSMGLMLAKQAINQALDAAGFDVALNAAFSLHQLGHSHNMQLHGQLGDPAGIDHMRILARRGPIA